MSPQPSEQSIFLHAVELTDPAARAAYLDDVCRDHPALRAELDALLQAHARLGAGPPDAGPVTATYDGGSPTAPYAGSPPPAAGTLLGGRYKLLEEVGEGGMGSVWMAEQTEPVERRVAVKVIKAGMDSKQVVARFEAERQALALMDHPHIARVFDGGSTPDGRPYFVMELVKGTPITRYCDEKKLAVRDRLALFADVCRAVQHAHQKGVIHRDLKPSNVLVAPYDGKAVVKVIDFGVAKATGQKLTDKTLFTGFGAVVGTPEYMSPEQAELNNQDIDTRSDVYALGVLLYELLTGTTPLTRERAREAALLEVLRVVREEEPPRPSERLSTTATLASIAAVRGVEPVTLSRLVRGELDWIAMKALDKDRTRRYETANGLAADVERYLADEPVAAGPPTAAYRLRKFVRRNRTAVGLGAVGVLVVLSAVGLVIGGLVYVNRETGAAYAAEKEAKDETTYALNRERAAAAERDESLREAARLAFGQGTMLARDGDGRAGLLWQARALELLPPDSADLDRAIRLNLSAWEDGSPVPSLVAPQDGKPPPLYTPDSQRVVTVNNTHIHVWEVATGREAYPAIRLGGEPVTVRFTPNGRQLVALSTHSESRSVSISRWAVADGSEVKPAFRREQVRLQHFPGPMVGGRQATVVRAADNTCDVLLFDAESGEVTTPLTGLQPPERVFVVDEGKALLVAERPVNANSALPNQLELRRWDLDKGEWGEVRIPVRGGWQNPIEVRELLSPNGDRVIANAPAGKLAVKDTRTGEVIGPEFPLAAATRSVAIRTDGILAALVGEGQPTVVSFWQGGPRPQFSPNVRRLAQSVRRIETAPDGQTQYAWLDDGSVRLWTVRGERSFRHRGQITAVAFSPDGRLLLTGGDDGLARLWDIVTGKAVSRPIALGVRVTAVAFAPDGRSFLTRAAVGLGMEQGVRVWAVPSPPVADPVSKAGRVLAVDPVHGLAAVLEGNPGARPTPSRELTVRRLGSAERAVGPLVHTDARSVASATFTPAGDHLITVADTLDPPGKLGARMRLHVWDLSDGREIAKTEVSDEILTAFARPPAVSPDGRWVAVGSKTGRVLVWDAKTGELATPPDLRHSEEGTPPGRGGIWVTAFSPDGKRLATAGYDGRAKLWRVPEWTLAHSLDHAGPVLAVGFSEADECLTGCADGYVRLWYLVSGQPVGNSLPVDKMTNGVAGRAGVDLIATAWQTLQLWHRPTGLPVGPELDAFGSCDQVSIEPGGLRLTAISGSRSVWSLRLPTPVEGTPAEVRRRVEVATGFRLGAGGDLIPLTTQEWLERRTAPPAE